MFDNLIKKNLQFQLNQANALVGVGGNGAALILPAINGAVNNILGAVVNGNIGAAQRAIIQGHVTTLPRVTNA